MRQAASVAKAAGKPMIAFSTDVGVASPGVYLLSFLIEGYVDRIAQFAASRGKKSFAVMAPQNDYGNIAVAEFQQTAGRLNAPVVVIARYAPGDAQSAAQQIAAVGGQIDALFIPEQADGMPAVAHALWRRAASRRSFWAPASGTMRGCCGCRSFRAPGSPRPTTRASTPWRSATRPSSTAIRRGWRRSPTTR